MKISSARFNSLITEYFTKHRRHFPWRETIDPYAVMVSEMMLQQTQTSRVVPYFEKFLKKFPTVQALAESDSHSLLELWQGLGYNRRALYLKAAAQKIVSDFHGRVPNLLEELVSLPGIGINTAGAILAYAFNQPSIFVETNIRKTIIHFFFKGVEKVSDQEILAIIEKVIDRKNPREWYWAVVDYGNKLGLTNTVSNSRSSHYIKQGEFVGSKRFTRSQMLKYLLRAPRKRHDILSRFANLPHSVQSLNELLAEGFCIEQDSLIKIRD